MVLIQPTEEFLFFSIQWAFTVLQVVPFPFISDSLLILSTRPPLREVVGNYMY